MSRPNLPTAPGHPTFKDSIACGAVLATMLITIACGAVVVDAGTDPMRYAQASTVTGHE